MLIVYPRRIHWRRSSPRSSIFGQILIFGQFGWIWSDYVGFGRILLHSLGLGRIWLDLVDLVGLGWNRSDSVRLGRIWLDLVGFGRNGRILSDLVGFGWSSPWEGTLVDIY